MSLTGWLRYSLAAVSRYGSGRNVPARHRPENAVRRLYDRPQYPTRQGLLQLLYCRWSRLPDSS